MLSSHDETTSNISLENKFKIVLKLHDKPMIFKLNHIFIFILAAILFISGLLSLQYGYILIINSKNYFIFATYIIKNLNFEKFEDFHNLSKIIQNNNDSFNINFNNENLYYLSLSQLNNQLKNNIDIYYDTKIYKYTTCSIDGTFTFNCDSNNTTNHINNNVTYTFASNCANKRWEEKTYCKQTPNDKTVICSSNNETSDTSVTYDYLSKSYTLPSVLFPLDEYMIILNQNNKIINYNYTLPYNISINIPSTQKTNEELIELATTAMNSEFENNRLSITNLTNDTILNYNQALLGILTKNLNNVNGSEPYQQCVLQNKTFTQKKINTNFDIKIIISFKNITSEIMTSDRLLKEISLLSSVNGVKMKKYSIIFIFLGLGEFIAGPILLLIYKQFQNKNKTNPKYFKHFIILSIYNSLSYVSVIVAVIVYVSLSVINKEKFLIEIGKFKLLNILNFIFHVLLLVLLGYCYIRTRGGDYWINISKKE